VLKERKWSRKACKAKAAEHSLPLQSAWQAQAATWRADQVICLDESASNERTGDRKFGWSPIGVACQTSRPLRCLE